MSRFSVVPVLVPVMAAALLLSACATNNGGSAQPGEFGMNKTTGGTLIGGAAGALAGAQFGRGSGNVAAIAAGTLIGAFVGHEVGTSLDRADQMYAQRASVQAQTAPIGQAITWNNPQSGNSGTITPTRDGRDTSGAYCREFQQTITVGGKQEQAYGTACQQPDGTWKIVQ